MFYHQMSAYDKYFDQTRFSNESINNMSNNGTILLSGPRNERAQANGVASGFKIVKELWAYLV